MRCSGTISNHDGCTDGLAAIERLRLASRSTVVFAGALLILCAGCRPVPMAFPASLNSQRPEERVRAVKQAVDYPYASAPERRAVIELLVARLEDEDDAVRFFAILALERMEGTRLGYCYQDSADRRLRAVHAWRRHLSQKALESVPPAREVPAGDPVVGGRP